MKACYEPLSAGGGMVAVCHLPEGHEGRCDGGETERAIGEAFAAHVLTERWERERDEWDA